MVYVWLATASLVLAIALLGISLSYLRDLHPHDHHHDFRDQRKSALNFFYLGAIFLLIALGLLIMHIATIKPHKRRRTDYSLLPSRQPLVVAAPAVQQPYVTVPAPVAVPTPAPGTQTIRISPGSSVTLVA